MSAPEQHVHFENETLERGFKAGFALTCAEIQALGCVGPAFDNGWYNEVKKYGWQVEGPDPTRFGRRSKAFKQSENGAVINVAAETIGSFYTFIKAGLSLHIQDIDEAELKELTVAYAVATVAVSGFPLELTDERDSLGERWEETNAFFEAIWQDLNPDQKLEDNEYVEARRLQRLQVVRDRFRHGFADIILAARLEDRFGDRGILVLGSMLDDFQAREKAANMPVVVGHPLPPEIIEAHIKARSTAFNLAAFAIEE